jgi:hypothetical protein
VRGAPTTWLLSSVQLGLGKVPIPPVTKVPSPLKAPTRMYAILLFIFIPGNEPASCCRHKTEDLIHASALYILKIYWFSPTVISSMLRALVTVFEGLDPCKSDTIPPSNEFADMLLPLPIFYFFYFFYRLFSCLSNVSAVNPSHDKPIQFTIFQKDFLTVW